MTDDWDSPLISTPLKYYWLVVIARCTVLYCTYQKPTMQSHNYFLTYYVINISFIKSCLLLSCQLFVLNEIFKHIECFDTQLMLMSFQKQISSNTFLSLEHLNTDKTFSQDKV